MEHLGPCLSDTALWANSKVVSKDLSISIPVLGEKTLEADQTKLQVLLGKKSCIKKNLWNSSPYAPIPAPKHSGDKTLLLSSSLGVPDFWLGINNIDLKCN